MYVWYCDFVPSRQEDIIILAELSGIPNVVSCFLTQDIFSIPNSSLVDATRPEKLEAEEACGRVGKHVELVLEEAQ
jgi:hypothetical protein